MIDAVTKKPLRVRPGGAIGPWILLPYAQLEDLVQILNRNGFKYEVERHVISLTEGAGMIAVNFPPSVKAEDVQAAIDDAA